MEDKRYKIENIEDFIAEHAKYINERVERTTLQTIADKFNISVERVRQLAIEHNVEIVEYAQKLKNTPRVNSSDESELPEKATKKLKKTK